jgi:hypothetical protein
MTDRIGKKTQSKLGRWYGRWASWLGWLGLVLVAMAYLNKEILQKRDEKRISAVEAALKVIEADETSHLQISSNRSYGSERADPLESF